MIGNRWEAVSLPPGFRSPGPHLLGSVRDRRGAPPDARLVPHRPVPRPRLVARPPGHAGWSPGPVLRPVAGPLRTCGDPRPPRGLADRPDHRVRSGAVRPSRRATTRPTRSRQHPVLCRHVCPDPGIRRHRGLGRTGSGHRHHRGDQRPWRRRPCRDLPVLAVRLLPSAERSTSWALQGVAGGSATLRPSRLSRNVRGAPPCRPLPGPVPRLATLGGRGARLARRLPTARVLSLEPRQRLFVASAPPDGSGHRQSRCSRRSDGKPRGAGQAVQKGWARSLVEDATTSLGFRGRAKRSLMERSDFDAACDRLEAAGYTLEARDDAWPAFESARATYAPRLEAMARYWATPATSWLGDPVALRLPLHPRTIHSARGAPTALANA